MKLPNVFGVSAKNDVAVIVPGYGFSDWVYGVLIGIEVKPEISDHNIIQSQMECLITAYNSYFPTMQVCQVGGEVKLMMHIDSFPQLLTDMVHGGAAYWIQKENGETTMKYRSLPGFIEFDSLISQVLPVSTECSTQ